VDKDRSGDPGPLSGNQGHDIRQGGHVKFQTGGEWVMIEAKGGGIGRLERPGVEDGHLGDDGSLAALGRSANAMREHGAPLFTGSEVRFPLDCDGDKFP